LCFNMTLLCFALALSGVVALSRYVCLPIAAVSRVSSCPAAAACCTSIIFYFDEFVNKKMTYS